MGTISVLHTADLHLGTAFQGLPPEIGRQRRRELMQTLSKIVDLCRLHRVELLLLSGDLWENKYVTKPLVDFVSDQFRRIPDTQVIIAPGDSDCLEEKSFYRFYPWPANVSVFLQPQLTSFWLPQYNVRIWGLAWTEQAPPQPRWEEVFIGGDTGQNIVLAHGSPAELGLDEQLLADERISYFALAGGHNSRTWSSLALQPGSPEPLGCDQPGQHGVLLGRIGLPAAKLELVPTARRKYVTLTLDLQGEENLAQVVEYVQARVDEHDLCCLKLRGQRNEEKLDIDMLAKELLSRQYYLKIDDQTRCNYNLEAVRAVHHGGVVSKFIDSIGQCQGNDDILKFGLDALLWGRVGK